MLMHSLRLKSTHQLMGLSEPHLCALTQNMHDICYVQPAIEVQVSLMGDM